MWETIMRGERWSSELVNRHKDGTLYDVSLTIMPITDDAGEIVSFVSVQSDITRLKELDRLKSKFVSNVSHELRTPLTNITTYLTLLERGREERRVHYMKVLNIETERLTRLIQDLLDLSRLETAPRLMEVTSSDLYDSLQSHHESFLPRAEAKQIQFSLEIPFKLPLVLIERNHLSQLLTNLLANAVAYTPEGGQIILSAGSVDDAEPPMAWVQVADTGAGISEEDQKHLFERFFRGEGVQLSGMPGTGLGLAICKEIVDRYDGRIEVESELGVGSRFTVWLPTA
jgi:signal transduction histidine kinase